MNSSIQTQNKNMLIWDRTISTRFNSIVSFSRILITDISFR